MKRFLSIVLMSLAAVSMSAQTGQLSESFDLSKDLPSGWSLSDAGGDFKWKVVSYDEDWNLNVISGFYGSRPNLIRVESGRVAKSNGTDGVSPDSWLISPKVSITEGDYLNFMMAYNGSFNGNFWVTPEMRTRFEILVSETDTAKESFKTVIFERNYQMVGNWHHYSIDLSKFKGKSVYFAFREYGKCNDKPFLKNFLFLDDIEVSKTHYSDLSLVGMTSPVSSCAVNQKVKADVLNSGKPIDSFTMCYQVDNDPIVKELVNIPILTGDTLHYTFNKEAFLSRNNVHQVRSWLELGTDLNKDNDTIRKPLSVLINEDMHYPYKMTDENAKSTFHAIGSTPLGKQVFGWDYVNVPELGGNIWQWTYLNRISSTLLSNCILLPQGKVKMLFDYQTLFEADLEIHLIDESGFGDRIILVPSLAATEDLKQMSVTLDIPEGGLYKIALRPDQKFHGRLYIKNIEFKDVFDDIQASAILSPNYNAYPVGAELGVSARINNVGGNSVSGFDVCYSIDGQMPVKESVASLPSVGSLDYIFKKPLPISKTGSHTLKVWTVYENDQDVRNDTATYTFNVYSPVSFPFKSSFEENEEEVNKAWVIYNPDNDLIKWNFQPVVDRGYNLAKDGKIAAYITSISGIEHNDWLISPLIKLPKGKIRVSYYYLTRMTTKDPKAISYLSTYLSKTSDTKEILKLQPAGIETITNSNAFRIAQGYALLDVPEAGSYYISIYNSGMGHDIVLDDIRIDNFDDLCMLGVTNTAKTGFNLKDNTVTITFANHGANAVSDVPVLYEAVKNQPVRETFAGPVNPGDTVSYVFKTKNLFPETDREYSVLGRVDYEADIDKYNNVYYSAPIFYFGNDSIPYAANFETPVDRAKWTLDPQWITGEGFVHANSAYDGKGAIRHQNKAVNSNGDWAYSGCISLKKGEYDLSFFYRTFMNMADPNTYGQTVEVFLGTAPNAESMSDKPVCKLEEVVCPTKQYDKVICNLIVPEDGLYYIGFKCTSAHDAGSIFIDDVEINDKVTTGINLYEPYESDFEKKEYQWYHYNPSNIFQQWVFKSENSDKFMQVQRASFSYSKMPTELPGIYLAPAFYLKKGNEIEYSYDYSIAIDHPEQLDAEEKDRIKIGLSLSDINIPKTFKEIAKGATVDGKKNTVKGRFTVPKDGVYYLGFLADGALTCREGTVISTYRIYNLKLRDKKIESVVPVDAQNLFSYDNHSLAFHKEYKVASIFNMNGQLIGEYRNEPNIVVDSFIPGVYLIRILTNEGQAVTRFDVR